MGATASINKQRTEQEFIAKARDVYYHSISHKPTHIKHKLSAVLLGSIFVKLIFISLIVIVVIITHSHFNKTVGQEIETSTGTVGAKVLGTMAGIEGEEIALASMFGGNYLKNKFIYLIIFFVLVILIFSTRVTKN